MKRILIATSAALIGMSLGASAMASDAICTAQQAATPDLVQARDDGAPIEEVIAAVEAGASSPESAATLSSSVEAIYADPSMDTNTASQFVYDRCMEGLAG